MRADLHTHTTLSDGFNEPSDNVRMAKKIGLAALAITDHDSILGIDEAIHTAKELGNIEIIPGIEMSTLENGKEVHILGYFIDYKDKVFLQRVTESQKARANRNELMIEKLNELNIEITMAEVIAKIKRKETKIGRPHIAQVLVDKGVVKTTKEAFIYYLGKNGKAYANTIKISPSDSIDIIKAAGGVAVIAHPGIYNNDQMVIRLIEYGLAGLEVYHPDHSRSCEKKYLQLTEEYNILATGGSDFHGERGGEIFHSPIGGRTVSYEIVKKLKALSKNEQNKR